MSPGVRRPWAWVPLSVTVALVVCYLLLPPNQTRQDNDQLGGWSLSLLLVLQALTFAAVGRVITLRQPGHAIGRFFGGVGLFVSLYLFVERYQYSALVRQDGGWPFGEVAAWLQTWLYVPALLITVVLLPQLFPTGRPVSRRWRPVLWLTAVASTGMVLADATAPGRIDQSTIDNPAALSASSHAVLEEFATSVYLLTALAAFAAFLARWRGAGWLERQQLKVFAFVAALLPLAVIVSGISETLGASGAVVEVVSFVAASCAFLGIPVATAIGILRHRLFDIDIVIKRTLVYAPLAASLVVTYLGLVLAMQALLPIEAENDLLVAVSTLAVAALFRPLRNRILDLVDRRFYRSRYDASRTLADFGARLRDQVDIEALGGDLRYVVQDTMQPAHVSLWLRQPEVSR
jgi:hypothetical protein